MPNYSLSYQLDFAVSLFKDAYKKSKQYTSNTEKNRKKWAAMSLQSSNRKSKRD